MPKNKQTRMSSVYLRSDNIRLGPNRSDTRLGVNLGQRTAWIEGSGGSAVQVSDQEVESSNPSIVLVSLR